MELRHLRYFIAVAEEANFTRAAKRLHIQQPPLSQQIQDLEEELGFALFERHRKGATLTAGGAAFLLEARAILGNVKAGAERASRAAQGASGLLRLGFTSSAAAHELVPRIIRAFRAKWPMVALELREENAGELTRALEAGDLDAGFLRQPVRRPDGMRFDVLTDEEMLLVLPHDHPALAGADAAGLPTVPLAALRGDPFVMLRHSGNLGMYASLAVACERAGFTPQVAIEVERMLTIVSLVAAGVGVSAVPASMRGFLSDAVAYCRIADRDGSLAAPLTLAWVEDNRSPTLANFRTDLQSIVDAGVANPSQTSC